MALFKCKMCGGSLEVAEGEAIAECQYCGASQTLPKTNDENIQGLFNRANLLRRKCEFDKAEEIYERIIEADEGEAEAYWGVILCKFGIEYVEDPKSFKRIPTCHRTSYDSIASDEYYKKALEYAELGSRSLYEAEAKEIDRLQREILAISKREEPYDVFICYKETDESGKRTQDSVIANDIYYQLTNEGYKVFYAAITLEDKVGQAYEPIIFAALNSAKVMLAIGTRPEYFGAVWVKNEWSRFLKMMKSDRSKLLIPCYRDMDAYELPEEFAHLQAQDMSKIGFINDIVRGIKKLIHTYEPKVEKTVIKEYSAPAGGNVSSLLRRVHLFLEDKDFASADEYCEKILDMDPENAEAYLCKLMVELKVTSEEELKNQHTSLDDFGNFKKAVRFADESRAAEIFALAEGINQRILEKAENERKESVYVTATLEMRKGYLHGYRKAVELFKTILDWKDSGALISECEERIEQLGEESKECEERQAFEDQESREKREEFERRKAIEKEKRKKCIKRIIKAAAIAVCVALLLTAIISVIFAVKKSSDYNSAKAFIAEGKDTEAYDLLIALGDYEDSQSLVNEIRNRAVEKAFEQYSAGDAGSAKAILMRVSANPDLIEAFEYYSNGDYKRAVNYGLTDIIIPDSVTSIGDSAFQGCYKLTSITIPDSVTSIGFSAFESCSSLASITIPDSVTSIGGRAFYWCTALTSVTIPDSVTSIGDSAFYGCYSLTNITIPDSVTSIGNWAFYGCDSLTSITIPDSVTSIDDGAFSDCDALTSVTIGNGVTSIGDDAFDSCYLLTSVVIGNGVTSIGYSAFYGCYKLTDVYYTGTEEEWRNINIDYGNNNLTYANIHYNYVIPEE